MYELASMLPWPCWAVPPGATSISLKESNARLGLTEPVAAWWQAASKSKVAALPAVTCTNNPNIPFPSPPVFIQDSPAERRSIPLTFAAACSEATGTPCSRACQGGRRWPSGAVAAGGPLGPLAVCCHAGGSLGPPSPPLPPTKLPSPALLTMQCSWAQGRAVPCNVADVLQREYYKPEHCVIIMPYLWAKTWVAAACGAFFLHQLHGRVNGVCH